jgi:hypothetical protein
MSMDRNPGRATADAGPDPVVIDVGVGAVKKVWRSSAQASPGLLHAASKTIRGAGSTLPA